MRTPRIQDLLEIISQYNVSQGITKGEFGWVNYDQMRITIDKRQTMKEKVTTLLHEALHVYWNEREENPEEEEIVRQTRIIYRRLYGKD